MCMIPIVLIDEYIICSCNFTEFLSELTEILLYLLLPDEDFQCKPVRYVLRELLASCIIRPLLNLISDPDYINQVVTWLVCSQRKELF